ncbi:hypothetical protein BH20ACT22_BH20ACT22_12660 [soil metagenome]
MVTSNAHGVPPWRIRAALPRDLPGARAFMLRVLEEDFDDGFRLDWHSDIADIDTMTATYLSHSRQALFVAVDQTGCVLATTAVREDGPRCPPHPDWLAARYAGPESAQLMRVWVAREHRQRGIARHLVSTACRWAASAGYRT